MDLLEFVNPPAFERTLPMSVLGEVRPEYGVYLDGNLLELPCNEHNFNNRVLAMYGKNPARISHPLSKDATTVAICPRSALEYLYPIMVLIRLEPIA